MAAVVACGCGAQSPGTDVTQEPPTKGYATIEAWLAKGYYKSWHCESAPHPSRPPSPHMFNRICSNDLASGHGAGPFPVDAASVKEYWNAAYTKIIGYSVARHTAPGTTGDSWYWYERVPLASATPHDKRGVVADGWGFFGPPLSICVYCHSQAGKNGHTGHDFVFTQVK